MTSPLKEAVNHFEAERATAAANAALGVEEPWRQKEVVNTCRPVIGIARISRTDAACHSIENQIAEIKRYVAYKGHRLVHVYEDVNVSGKQHPFSDKRPGSKAAWLHALELRKQGENPMLCLTRLDRLSRRIADFVDATARLSKANIDLVFTQQDFNTSTTAGKMMAYNMAMVAEIEADQAGGRRQNTAFAQQRVGKFVGSRPPYGFKKDVHQYLRLNEDEERIMRIVRKLRSALPRAINGGVRWGEIAAALNERGYRNRSGGLWTGNNLRHVTPKYEHWVKRINRMSREGHPAYVGKPRIEEWEDQKGNESSSGSAVAAGGGGT